MRRLLLPLVLGALLLGCGDDDTTAESEEQPAATTTSSAVAAELPPDACDEAMSAAAEVDEMEDTTEDLHPAVRACTTLADWTAASDAHPDALDGAPPDQVAANLCLYGEGLAESQLCAELSEE